MPWRHVGPEALIEDVRWNTTEFVGAIMQPLDSWLTLQYWRTLRCGMERHSANSQQLAEFLAAHPKVAHVITPAAPTPQHECPAQMKGPGGLMSIVVPGGIDGAGKVIDIFKLIAPPSLSAPAVPAASPATSARHMTPEERDPVASMTA